MGEFLFFGGITFFGRLGKNPRHTLEFSYNSNSNPDMRITFSGFLLCSWNSNLSMQHLVWGPL